MHTPTSRNWQTPISNGSTTPTQCCKNRHYPSHSGNHHRQLTPVSSRRVESTCICTPSTNYLQTPSPISNPFESEYEHLQHAIVTPGVFRQSAEETPDKSKPFQWDIEHVALLHPVDFGDVTDKLKRQDRHCRKMDDLAQGAVKKFFEKEHIMPSPWSDSVPKVSLLTKIEEENSSTPCESKRHASSQTDIHIPLSVDFSEIFKRYRLSDSQIEDLNRGESFSNSSLRRKLFNNDSDCSMSDSTSEHLALSQLSNRDSSPMGDWCASSPVFMDRFNDSEYSRRCSVTAGMRRDSCSREPSPDLSPITSPFKPANTHQTGGIKTSPDLQEGLAKMKNGFTFNMQDEFHLSNSGLSTTSDSSDSGDAEENGAATNARHIDMSVDLHLSAQYPTETATHVSDYRAGQLSYMAAERTAAEHIQPMSFGQSDTGYQTCSLFDMSTTRELRASAGCQLIEKRQHIPTTPEKASTPDWEPPVASTPNKNHQCQMLL